MNQFEMKPEAENLIQIIYDCSLYKAHAFDGIIFFKMDHNLTQLLLDYFRANT